MIIQEAIMCKLWGCRPSELEREDPIKVLMFGEIYKEIAKENPMFMMM